MPTSHEARNRSSPAGRQPAAREIRHWLGAVFVTSVRYLFTRVPSYRRNRVAEPAATLPDFARELPGDPSTLQRVADGTGALYHRHFWIDITDAALGPDELIATLAEDLNAAAPGEMSRFETGDDDRSRTLQVGTEFVVRLPGPWDGPVRVIDRTPTSFRFATLDGHMEAGEIEFRSGWTDRGFVRFEIETWARSGDNRFRVLYDALPLAREAQAYMWSHFCARAPKLARGIVMSNVAVNTERFETGPWLADAAPERPVHTTAPVRGAALRLLHDLHRRTCNFDPDRHDTSTREPGWYLDTHVVDLPAERPGPPVPGGAWEVACRACEDYEFADPSIVRAAWFADVPLAEREMLVDGRFGPLRFPLGLRVGEVVDTTDEQYGRPVRRWGWNYRTLEGHLERGQMDFEVRKWLDTGHVQFHMRALSQRAHVDNQLVRLGNWMFGRPMQLAFARRGLGRMRAIVAERTGRRRHAV